MIQRLSCLTWHEEAILSIDKVSDQCIVSGSDDGTIRIWNLETLVSAWK